MSEQVDKYNSDYYERGIESGVSRYQNYRWMPESTMSMAMTLIDFLGLKRRHKILDYGCAKGYLVKALRLLHRQAWGVDISEYAISKVDKETNGYCTTLQGYKTALDYPEWFDYCIAKDVFEHIEKCKLKDIVIRMPANYMFVVVPLGKDGKYFAPANNLDVTHIICEDIEWWNNMFDRCGWIIESSSTVFSGIKDSYKELYPDAHGFFLLKRK